MIQTFRTMEYCHYTNVQTMSPGCIMQLEGGLRRSTDPIRSITTHTIYYTVSSAHIPTYYKLDPTARQRSFTREQVQVDPDDTELPPNNLA